MTPAPRRKKLTPPKEHDSQVAFFEWLRFINEKAWNVTYAVPNGIYGGNRFRGAWINKEGRKKGAPDIVMDYPVVPWHGARIEMKRAGQKATPEQLEMLSNLKEQGYRVAVCYSLEDAQEFVKSYLKI